MLGVTMWQWQSVVMALGSGRNTLKKNFAQGAKEVKTSSSSHDYIFCCHILFKLQVALSLFHHTCICIPDFGHIDLSFISQYVCVCVCRLLKLPFVLDFGMSLFVGGVCPYIS